MFLKYVRAASPEVAIERLLASEPYRNDTRNHGLPLLDVVIIPEDPDHVVLVFPLLRKIDDPEPASAREAVDFVHQTLEVNALITSGI